MTSFFYHLGFELRSSPPADVKANRLTQVFDTNTYLPPPTTDIFTSPLPIHSISSWSEPSSKIKNHRRSNTISSGSQTTLTSRARPSFTEQRPALTSALSAGDIKRRPVPDTPSPLSNPREKSTSKSNDWRFDRLSIQSIDMEIQDETSDGSRQRGLKVGQVAHKATPSRGMATRGKFIPSDPKTTEIGWGVVHLYRDAKETPGLDDDTSSTTPSDSAEGSQAQSFNEDDCTTLCILAVPSYMTPSDLLGFVGEQTREDVSHFRLIRTARANKYMVLMKFWEAKKAKLWRKEWNGKHFNSMEVRYGCYRRGAHANSDSSQRTATLYSSSLWSSHLPTPNKAHPASQR